MDSSQLAQTILPSETSIHISATHIFRDSIDGPATIQRRFGAELEHLPRILWRYGGVITALRYSVGRESSLPCSKCDVRQYLLAAISLTNAGNARARLRVGYVQLEVFITDAEFELVRDLQDSMGEADASVCYERSPRTLREMAARPEGAGTPASAILTRIAERMLARQQELWGDA